MPTNAEFLLPVLALVAWTLVRRHGVAARTP